MILIGYGKQRVENFVVLKTPNIRRYVRVRRDTKNCFIFIIIVIFAENASFTCKLRRHLLASMALTTPKPQNTDTNGIHATWA